ncbi:hypothetical protein [Kitasatospora sp. MBT63]|uniref:phosphorylase family protein n=1 Tax=Kitasatospora sp. MBT63 TaxID=1444768 RepID=UPI0009E8F379|nr:hypothetical protein [Kitasatospora sp. MBT63]
MLKREIMAKEDAKESIVKTRDARPWGTIGMPEFGIVTALPKEFAATKAMLHQPQRMHVPGDHNIYEIGHMPARDGSGDHSVVLTLQTQPGNNAAAISATSLLRTFGSITDVLMVGIAGGAPDHRRPGHHVRLGDIVISNHYGIIQYDLVSLSPEGAVFRGASRPPSTPVLAMVNYLEAERLSGHYPWEKHMRRGRNIPHADRPPDSTDVIHTPKPPYRGTLTHPQDSDRKPGHPKVHYGRIGSANILLRNPQIRDQLRDALDIRAFEMESSGIADGSGQHGFLAIRGICDYCDQYKNDIWQQYASIAAAAYARALIEAFPIDAAQ